MSSPVIKNMKARRKLTDVWSKANRRCKVQYFIQLTLMRDTMLEINKRIRSMDISIIPEHWARR